jgi:hypothetical protein
MKMSNTNEKFTQKTTVYSNSKKKREENLLFSISYTHTLNTIILGILTQKKKREMNY